MNNFSFSDPVNYTPKGYFEIKVKDKSGSVIYTYQDPNLVVNQSKSILAALLAGDPTKLITKIALGNNSASPIPDNTTISGIETTALNEGNNIDGIDLIAFVKPLDAHMFPDVGQVQFHWTLDYEEGNGLALCEFGLLSEDQNMFARKTRGVITKQSDLAMEGSWKIIF